MRGVTWGWNAYGGLEERPVLPVEARPGIRHEALESNYDAYTTPRRWCSRRRHDKRPRRRSAWRRPRTPSSWRHCAYVLGAELRGEFLVALPRGVQAALEPAVHSSQVTPRMSPLSFHVEPRLSCAHASSMVISTTRTPSGRRVGVLGRPGRNTVGGSCDDLLRHLTRTAWAGLPPLRHVGVGPDEVLLARLELSGMRYPSCFGVLSMIF